MASAKVADRMALRKKRGKNRVRIGHIQRGERKAEKKSAEKKSRKKEQ
jgi:hypothetical protein